MEEVKRIAVISDLHLGEEECLLNEAFLASEAFGEINRKHHQNELKDVEALQALRRKNIETLRKKLGEQGEIDELIILGDFLDYALAPLQQALANARDFFSSLLSGSSNIKKIVVVPGNHDYHLWQLVFVQQVVTAKDFLNILPDAHEYVKWMADQDSPFIKGRFTKTFLNAYIPKGSSTVLEVRYPHIWRKVGNQTYHFTHGHYIQTIFSPVSTLFAPKSMGELVAFNALWLEAVWYYLGQAGRLSVLVENIYEKRFTTDVKRDLQATIDNLLTELGVTKFPRWLLKRALVRLIVKKLRSSESSRELQSDTKKSSLRGNSVEKLLPKISDYIEHTVLAFNPDCPKPFTFVFGHTHVSSGKPDGTTYRKKVVIKGQSYPVENTGAWLEEKKKNTNIGFILIEKSGLKWVPVTVQ